MDKKSKKPLLIVVVFVALLIALVAISYAFNFTGGISSSSDRWGQFGDYFGGVLNPVLSFFAFSALLYTVYLQMCSSAEAEKRHDEQVFESRLFKLLSTNFEIACALSIKPGTRELKFDGFEALKYSWDNFKAYSLEGIDREQDSKLQFESVRVYLKMFKRSYSSAVSVYVDSVVFILEFIRLNGHDEQHRSFALHALRSQMTSCGRGLLFYHLICSEEYFHQAQTIMNFSFFDDLTDDPLCDVRHQLLSAAQNFHQSCST
ncbi:putative phage abortive infection protein [Pseudomonas sp. Irchel 3F5]|uniref:putative phage abortive infection protein n=1 Tax=Pseudomonas sp. Irchel 3F5 TaxID=2009002 RepID=UPI001594EF9B|nr:putative phage abortive infection protein [Pseudomonas sp. Irchel 3F5]